MTEATWLTSTDPQAMLAFLHGKTSDRKLRWFAAACCRKVCQLLADTSLDHVVKVSEQFSDGKVTPGILHKVLSSAASQVIPYMERVRAGLGTGMIEDLSMIDSSSAAAACNAAVLTTRWARNPQLEREHLSHLLRDIVGNPYRPIEIDPTLLTGDVAALAQAAYDERESPHGHLDSTRLAILADALEEAGCNDQGILGHCRGSGPHVMGCWLVDLLLGKE